MIFVDQKKKCSYEICRKLSLIGYSVGSDCCITKFKEDYIYDDEPEHPESHKAGDVRLYDFFYKNDEESLERQMFECPDLDDVAIWLSDNHYINIVPIKRENDGLYEVCLKRGSGGFVFDFERLYSTREEVLEHLISGVLDELMKAK